MLLGLEPKLGTERLFFLILFSFPPFDVTCLLLLVDVEDLRLRDILVLERLGQGFELFEKLELFASFGLLLVLNLGFHVRLTVQHARVLARQVGLHVLNLLFHLNLEQLLPSELLFFIVVVVNVRRNSWVKLITRSLKQLFLFDQADDSKVIGAKDRVLPEQPWTPR